jgi:hypothetical protein
MKYKNSKIIFLGLSVQREEECETQIVLNLINESLVA